MSETNDEQQELEQEFRGHLERGARHLRRARMAGIVGVGVFVAHFIYLVYPCAISLGGLRGLLVIGYPFLFAYLALTSLWPPPSPGRFRTGDSGLR